MFSCTDLRRHPRIGTAHILHDTFAPCQALVPGAGELATTSVPSADESIPLYTVRARIQRSGGLPLSGMVTKLLDLTSPRGGAVLGATLGGALEPPGSVLGGLVGGILGGAFGTIVTSDLRCGVDLDIVAPASVGDSPHGRWRVARLDIPFDFESARMF